MTLPLDKIGLSNARLDTSVTAQESSVTDPVTGLDREFLFLEAYSYEINFRQDFPSHKVSWGWALSDRGDDRGFGLDEVSIFSFDRPELDAFIETTVIKGIKARLGADDILNVKNTRDRTVFMGSRALDIPSFRELRATQNGGSITLSLSGTF